MATAANPVLVKAPRASYTPEQDVAVHTRDVPVALSAGAGCGKTFVLTERYLSHLEPTDMGAPSCDLSQLVAITFTDRAAREMRDRIRAKCFERLQQAPAEQGDYWLGLLRSLDSARVSTIHSFCGSLLRSHAVEAELDPRFAVLEAAQADTLLAEQIDDVLRTRLAARDDDVLELVVVFGLTKAREAIAEVVEQMRGKDVEAWLSKTPDEIVARWQEFHHTRGVPELLRCFLESPPAQELLRILNEYTFGPGLLGERQQALLRLLPPLASSQQVLLDLQEIHEHARIASVKKSEWPSDDVKQCFKAAAEKLRGRIDKIVAEIVFDSQSALASAKLGQALMRIAHDVERAYTAAKTELAVLDFDDLLLLARRLLTDPQHKRVRESLSRETRLLLVDECQDTDPVQVDLIKALCGEREAHKLFFVGDYKQSIYRFRGADPSVFRRLRAETPERGQLPLSRNFRSQPAILHFVNALFCEALGSEEMPYEPLVPHRAQTHPGPAIEFLWCLDDHAADAESDGASSSGDEDSHLNNGEPASAEELRRREADWIARRICQLLETEPCVEGPPLQLYDGDSQPRRVCKRDIAILFRSLSDVAWYEEALRRYKIDYYLVGGHAFYAQQEIYDVLNLLRSLVSQADEVSLAGVLRSPFFSLTDETLFWLAQQERGLWAGLCAEQLPPAIDGEQRHRVRYAACLLGELRAKKDRVGIAELLNEALSRTGYDAALLGEFLGERKLANLRKLIAQARDLDRAGVMTLSDFIVQLSQFVVRQPREPLAATHPEATDVVRLMTIHQSKGLEFPVVFVPDLGRQSNDRGTTADFSDELGPLVRLPQDHEHAGAINGYRLHRLANSAEDKQEAIRLFYVAATRAADFLVLSSGLKKLDGQNGPWMQLLAKRFDLSSGRCIAALPDSYPVPQISVCLEPPAVDVKPGLAHARLDLHRTVDEIEQAAVSDENATETSANPIPCYSQARRRFSVSRLLGTLEAAPPEGGLQSDWPVRVQALAAAGVQASASGIPTDAIELGVVVHAALATVNLADPGDLASEVSLHAEKLDVRSSPARAEAIRLIQQFVKSPRARELKQAQHAFREVEFLLAWPPAVGVQLVGCSDKQSLDPPQRYLQGYLDCLYQDTAGRWHLIDFKTNQVLPGTLPDLAAKYELQMLAYGLAAEQALGEPIAELVLHFLRTGDEYQFPWNDHTRQRAKQLVNQAIAAMCHPSPDSNA